MIINPFRFSPPPPPPDQDPDWANVVLALHGDGGSIVDEKGHALTVTGSVATSAAQSKFGGSSITFVGDGGISVGGNTYNADFDFGTGDFCVRGWLYALDTGDRVFFDCRQNGGSPNGFVIYTQANRLRFYTGVVFLTVDSEFFPVNTWVHIEASRVGGLLYVFRDGIPITEGFSFPDAMTDGRCFVGTANTGGFFWNGYQDDVEVVKGQGIHTAAFTPPTAPFPNS